MKLRHAHRILAPSALMRIFSSSSLEALLCPHARPPTLSQPSPTLSAMGALFQGLLTSSVAELREMAASQIPVVAEHVPAVQFDSW
jgi:hypothetical protein